MNKERYPQHIFDTWDGDYLIGPLSRLTPSSRRLELVYSDGSTDTIVVDSATTNFTENPLTGKIDVVIKLTLEKEEKANETNCL